MLRALLVPLLSLLVLHAAAERFHFGGVSFEQENTPDIIVALPLGSTAAYYRQHSLDPNPVNITHLPSSSPSVAHTGFPDKGRTIFDFQGHRSLGYLFQSNPADSFRTASRQLDPHASDDSAKGPHVSALVLFPDGQGHDKRAGFQVGWSKNRWLLNIEGPDFVLYQEGLPGRPKGYMLSVRSMPTQTWSPWVYQAATTFQQYTPGGTNMDAGVYTIVFDLSSFGIAAGGKVDRIRYVNMNNWDRMANPTSRQGIVLAGDDGHRGYAGADAGALASQPEPYVTFGTSTYNPTPLYIGVVNSTMFTNNLPLPFDDEDIERKPKTEIEPFVDPRKRPYYRGKYRD